jgi:CheY-like chemotaxis protein
MSDFDLSGKHVLIVDDSRHFLSLLTSVLHGFGCRQISRSTEAADAFEIISRETVDLAIVDYKMPMLNGFEFASLVRSAKDTSNRFMPMFLVTGHGSRQIVMDSITNGFDDFLLKPIRPIDLYRKMVRHFEHPLPYIRTPGGYFGPDRRRKTDPNRRGDKERRCKDLAVRVDGRAEPSEVRSKRNTPAKVDLELDA